MSTKLSSDDELCVNRPQQCHLQAARGKRAREDAVCAVVRSECNSSSSECCDVVERVGCTVLSNDQSPVSYTAMYDRIDYRSSEGKRPATCDEIARPPVTIRGTAVSVLLSPLPYRRSPIG